MHCHTFFSFNAYGHSPSSLAWLAKKSGYRLLGIVDFDVLDAVDEFLDACELLEVRGSAGMETRAFIPEFADQRDQLSWRAGCLLLYGDRFYIQPGAAESAAALADLRQRAANRNRLVMERVNAYLAPVLVDYDQDVLPLTPAGNATERHMILACLLAAERQAPDLQAFWAEKLELPVDRFLCCLRIRLNFRIWCGRN
jgi:hypothetical protein